MIKKILVALDGSERAQGVLEVAAEMAHCFGATLYPFRAVAREQPPASASVADAPSAALCEEAKSEVLRLTVTVQATTDVRVGQVVVEVGQPWREILRASEELDVDLVVIGSHGYHGLDRMLGTTAGKVTNLAHRDVFVVHNRDYAPAGAARNAYLTGEVGPTADSE